MATSARTVREQIDGRKVKVQIEQLHNSEYEVRFTFADLDQEPRERWEFGVDSEQEAELITTTETEQELSDPDFPGWIEDAMLQYDIEVA